MSKVGVILSGCGHRDGAEIREAVLTLLALEKAGLDYECFAPDVEQRDVVDHLTGEASPAEKRNVLREAARIARGKVRPTSEARAAALAGLVVPGGYGAAKNLCDFAVAGPDCTVEPSVAKLIRDVHAAGKPIGFICIAPALAARLIPGAKLTIGRDAGTAEAIEKMGAKHVECFSDSFVSDDAQKVLSTPAYMCDATLPQIAAGIEAMVRRLGEMTPR
ncbi:Glyoxalase ElbB [Myxococcaceae bacterium]|jgi:enhancing lycopene biosynthesis protein 2|nr:Glyoxalase ElbB [Myxococcaceae bacterium]